MKSSGPDEYEDKPEDESPDGNEDPRAAAAKKILETEFQEAEHEGPEAPENYLKKGKYEIDLEDM